MTNAVERPEHEAIMDCRGTGSRTSWLTLFTYKTTLRTSLQLFDNTFEMDREGRDKLITELLRANEYEDQHKSDPELGDGGDEKMALQYTRQSATEYTVWRKTSHRIGVVQKMGSRWLAISPAHRSLGSYASMSEAAQVLVDLEERNGDA